MMMMGEGGVSAAAAAAAMTVDSNNTVTNSSAITTGSSNQSESNSTAISNVVMINDDVVMEDALAEEAVNNRTIATTTASASAGTDTTTSSLSNDVFEEAPSFDELLATSSVAVTSKDNLEESNNDDRSTTTNGNRNTEVEDAMVIDTTVSPTNTSNYSTTGYATAETIQYIEWLRSDASLDRAKAMQHLDTVGTALGLERCCKELLPFLSELADADEDEVLGAMAEHFPKLISILQQQQQQCKSAGSLLLLQQQEQLLFLPLEKLLMVEETCVREQAIASSLQIYQQIISNQQQQQQQQLTCLSSYFSDMIVRLATKEWFTARMSACTLIATEFTSLTTHMNQHKDATTITAPFFFLEIFVKLCRDEVPIVRRMACQHLGTVFEQALPIFYNESSGSTTTTAHTTIVSNLLLPIYREISTSDQDSIRICIADNCISFAKAIGIHQHRLPTIYKEQFLTTILPILITTADDRSWRVRWKTASKFHEVAQVFTPIVTQSNSSSSGSTGTGNDSTNINKSSHLFLADLYQSYERLLQDPEAEVRTSAAFNLGEVARCLISITPTEGITSATLDNMVEDDTNENSSKDRDSILHTTLMSLVQKIPTLADDEAEHVRAALALVISELSPTLGKQLSLQHLLPSIFLLLRDSTSAEVRLNMISSLGPLKQTLGDLEALHPVLFPAITALASSEGEQGNKWRVRLSVISHMPLLAEQLGPTFFNEQFTNLCVSWLADDISSIREAAATNVMNLVAVFGPTWAHDCIYPPLMALKCHPSYLRRLSAVQAASFLTTKVERDTPLMEHIVPLIVDMASDTVPNVRFNVARALHRISQPCGLTIYQQRIRPVLSVLTEDPDRDVRFFAEQSLHNADHEFGTSTSFANTDSTAVKKKL
jgi:serine/threonine-protein phosphatase 2A regulatory subunit A